MGALVWLHSPAAAALPYAGEVQADSPDAYWRLAETSGGAANDETSTIGGATYNGGVTLGGTGLVPSDPAAASVSLDGSSGWVEIPDHPLINTGGPYTAATVELFFQADDLSDPNRIQMIYEQGGGSRGLNLYLHGSTLYMGGWNVVADDPTTPWGALSVTTSVLAGSVYHAALVYLYDVGTGVGTITGYVNGASIGSAAGAGRLFSHGGDPGLGAIDGRTFYAHTGARSPAGERSWFEGSLAELALYPTALSAADLSRHWTSATTLVSPEPGTALLVGAGLALLGRRRRRAVARQEAAATAD